MILSVHITEPPYPPNRLYPTAMRSFSSAFGLWVDYLGQTPTVAEVQAHGIGVTRMEAEVDFGVVAVDRKVFTVVDAACRIASVIIAVQSGNPGTGKSVDEVEMDRIVYVATPGIGSFTLFARSLDGPVSGKHRVAYSLS